MKYPDKKRDSVKMYPGKMIEKEKKKRTLKE